MVEQEETKRIICQGDDGRSLTVVLYQYFETVVTDRGVRKRPGAICLELTTGEAVREIDQGCFEIIPTGEFIKAAPDGNDEFVIEAERDDIPLCRYEEIARQENRLWEARRKADLPTDDSDQAASSSSAGPKNS